METINTRPQFLRTEGKIAGVAEGLARDFGIDVVVLRIILIIAACFGVGLGLYIACWIAFPKQSDADQGRKSRLMGVCWEVAKRTNQPVGLIRLAALGLLCVSFGTAIVGYVIAAFVIPTEKVPGTPQ